MSIDRRRLDRLMPGLTPRERAILALRAIKAGTPGNLAWRQRMPSYQIMEFNRLACLINACNCYLPQMITVLEQLTEQLRLRCSWLIFTVHLGDALTEIAALLPPTLRQEAEQVAAREPLVELPWREDGHERSWSAVVDRNGESVRWEVAGLWRQLQALERVLAEGRSSSTARTRWSRPCDTSSRIRAGSWKKSTPSSPRTRPLACPNRTTRTSRGSGATSRGASGSSQPCDTMTK
jgi:hypothetical protein